ncbi:serine protease 33 [Coregonus clupeaformis]|uniref:serine protease 33 n=1 Tax=Coregonus clupeaformis TaxID=59861 RepID=UPI001E1C62D7|nr:serine protease 33 [Coregonus clupeaformis]
MIPKSEFYVRLFCCFTGILVCHAQVECGQPLLENRIVGGVDASQGAWPWQVDIQTEKDGHICGGSIITQEWVLSAAHCFPNPFDVSGYTLYVGRHQLNGFNPNEMSHRVKRIVIPSSYSDPNFGQDMALVQLQSPVVWSAFVRPICLPDAWTLFPGGLLCYVTGWGNIRDGVPLGGVGTLQQVKVPIISSSSCQMMYSLNPPVTVNILSDMICAGYQEGGRDSCQGDSGGPLVCQMVNGTWVQAGVVSFGLGCANANQPGVYAKVSTFSSFIRSNIPEISLYGRAGPNWASSLAVLASSLATLLMGQLL